MAYRFLWLPFSIRLIDIPVPADGSLASIETLEKLG
jgi:hypothetical protein